MSTAATPLVADIRAASRELVREFGLMNRTVADTDLSLSGVHAIIEIGRADGLTAKALGEKLLLEKSTISRLVRSLIDRGELREERSSEDLRAKRLYLTRQGRRTLGVIDQFAEAQVAGALTRLDGDARLCVLRGLEDYAAALRAAAENRQSAFPRERLRIRNGYTATIIARTVEMLHGYMHAHFDFGLAFESRIASDLIEFMARIESPANGIWRAEIGGRIVGSISIDGEDLGDELAHLRWFTVADGMRGTGVGEKLLAAALAFCDRRGYRETQLWTVKGLDAARRLYERHGFVLAEEYEGDQWGSRVIEHKFVRPLPQG